MRVEEVERERYRGREEGGLKRVLFIEGEGGREGFKDCESWPGAEW